MRRNKSGNSLRDQQIACIGAGETIAIGRAYRQHAVAMRRLEGVIEANPDRALYIAELCAATRVSERMLRACCQEHLGMSPTRYLWLRRMHLARRALRSADPTTTAVTEIAAQYGFWELGRFSVAYRALVGEATDYKLPDAPERRGMANYRHLSRQHDQSARSIPLPVPVDPG